MNLFKIRINFILISLQILFCNSCYEKSENQNNPIEEKAKSSIKTKKTFNENSWNLIKQQKFNADSLIQILHPDSTLIGGKFHYKIHECNLDSDSENEILIEFGSEHIKTLAGFLFVFDLQNGAYQKIYEMTFEDLYDDDWKLIPELKMAFLKFRVNGTCDDGFEWQGYKWINNKLKQVVSTYGEHEGNSCGSYTEKDDAVKDFEIHSRSFAEIEPINENKFLVHVRFSEWFADQYMDTKVETIIPETKVILTYIYNNEKLIFECFNSRREKLFEEGFMGLSFELIEMYKEGKF